MAKGQIEAKAERRCARCKKLSRAMLKNREGHHSDDAVKKRGMNCDVKKLRCEKNCVVHRCVPRCSVVVH